VFREGGHSYLSLLMRNRKSYSKIERGEVLRGSEEAAKVGSAMFEGRKDESGSEEQSSRK
jgi:hypothetical protein